jgi:hypothetical protein
VSEVRQELRRECLAYLATHFEPEVHDVGEFWGEAVRVVVGGPRYDRGGHREAVRRSQFSEHQLRRLMEAGQEIYLLAESWRERYPDEPEPRSDGWAALLALSETCGKPGSPWEKPPVEEEADRDLTITYEAVVLWLINVQDGLAEASFSFFTDLDDFPPTSDNEA